MRRNMPLLLCLVMARPLLHCNAGVHRANVVEGINLRMAFLFRHNSQWAVRYHGPRPRNGFLAVVGQ